ncbi:MAG TPA: hypothetical protein VEI29_00115 [Burkholderiaceae bacterium]|nr:hypothetical protein [Burkholderiaceae bacterium]
MALGIIAGGKSPHPLKYLACYRAVVAFHEIQIVLFRGVAVGQNVRRLLSSAFGRTNAPWRDVGKLLAIGQPEQVRKSLR